MALHALIWTQLYPISRMSHALHSFFMLVNSASWPITDDVVSGTTRHKQMGKERHVPCSMRVPPETARRTKSYNYRSHRMLVLTLYSSVTPLVHTVPYL